jgi:hypothetical protein
MILQIAEGRVMSMETSPAGQRNHRVERVVESAKRFWGRATQTTRGAADRMSAAGRTAGARVSAGAEFAQLKREERASRLRLDRQYLEVGRLLARLYEDPDSPIREAASPELQSALESAAGTEQSLEELRQRLEAAAARARA